MFKEEVYFSITMSYHLTKQYKFTVSFRPKELEEKEES